MKNLDTIISQIEEIVERLSMPLSPEDINCGWRDKSKEAMIRFFRTMLSDFQNKPPRIKIEYMTIARGLDAWGIDGGILEEKAIKISRAVNEFKNG